MRIHLVSATRSPVRLVKDGRELRQLHGLSDMFRDGSSAIMLDETSSVTVVAPYNRPGRPGVWFLLGMAAGLLAMSLGIDMTLLQAAAFLPLAFAIVLAILPVAVSTPSVLVRLVAGGHPHMLALRREDLSAFRTETPDAEWKDEEEGLGSRPLNRRERLRLRLMQIGLVMTMTSLSTLAMLYIQQQPGMIRDGDVSGEMLIWLLRGAEVVALALFASCWVAIVRTGMKARKERE